MFKSSGMDPLEARLQFIKLVARLNASVRSNQQAISFMLKYPDLQDDLYSCVLEELEKPTSSLNLRLNIMFMLESLVNHVLGALASASVSNSSSFRQGQQYVAERYIKWINRDLPNMVQYAVPETYVGMVNLEPVRTFLSLLEAKQKFVASCGQDRIDSGGPGGKPTTQKILQAREILDQREKTVKLNIDNGVPNSETSLTTTTVVVSNPTLSKTMIDQQGLDVLNIQPKPEKTDEKISETPIITTTNIITSNTTTNINTPTVIGVPQFSFNADQLASRPSTPSEIKNLIIPSALTAEQILQRMEEDRERSKRVKEDIWAIDYKVNFNAEFERVWRSRDSVLSEVDLIVIKEENDIRAQAIRF
ncbi:hypothetical protein NADFUDRAFT_51921 [Nadsonia fulvescens var. elongata DSM 6958]|uniref:CID domain-containing protein n=1 Tax=Nadsonia fulvescens var. elongata DSM 6958 TaxID=857566 RepID=A0A1E3PKF7_9ASCO|nr:hypothetical protein NADFUDRAFT_51921 [Nadsonia fulvescens var. elongata DSM 6958]